MKSLMVLLITLSLINELHLAKTKIILNTFPNNIPKEILLEEAKVSNEHKERRINFDVSLALVINNIVSIESFLFLFMHILFTNPFKHFLLVVLIILNSIRFIFPFSFPFLSKVFIYILILFGFKSIFSTMRFKSYDEKEVVNESNISSNIDMFLISLLLLINNLSQKANIYTQVAYDGINYDILSLIRNVFILNVLSYTSSLIVAYLLKFIIDDSILKFNFGIIFALFAIHRELSIIN